MTNSSVKISGFNNKTIGTQTITLTYKGKSTTFTIEIRSEAQGLDRGPTLSNFNNATGEIIETQYNFFIHETAESYANVKIKISNIKIGSEDNTYTDYYYLSGKQGETDIPENNWKEVKAQKENDGTYSITINTSTKDIENFYKICESDNVFIYLKEIAQFNGIKNSATPKFYLDREEVEGIDAILDAINQNNSGKDPTTPDNPNTPGTPSNPSSTVTQQQGKKDDTTASNILPQTGIISIAIIILGLAIMGGYSYYRYKNIDR